MPTLKQVLRSYRTAAPKLGPARTPRRSVETLSDDLQNVSRSNQIYFAICFGCVVALFIGAGIVAVRFVDTPSRIAAVLGALGISVMGLITQMASLWKQKVASDMLLVLCREADEAHLQKIIDGLLEKL
jgi:multisubunit Na+/H+ antiporter MnhF subunit